MKREAWEWRDLAQAYWNKHHCLAMLSALESEDIPAAEAGRGGGGDRGGESTWERRRKEKQGFFSFLVFGFFIHLV